MPIKLQSTGGGAVTIDVPSTTASPTVTLPANTGTIVVTDTQVTGNISVTGTVSMGSSFLRNRIINGDMRIDQRNAGASVGTGSGTGVYSVDRWQLTYDQLNKFTAQQNASSVTPPAGYTNYLGITSSSAYSVGSSEQFVVRQYVEGFNVADFGWGTANAQSITISFWVRSSLTGTFGGAVSGYANTNSYPFTFTISSANTWEQKTITIAGATTGTWNTNNSGGIGVIFGLGVGSTLSGTAGAWSTSRFWSATGATSVVGINGATFYLTGVQLEVGSVATPFERRLYGQELALCQRYLPAFSYGGGANPYLGSGMASSASVAYYVIPYMVRPRVPSTGLVVSSASHFAAFLASTGTSNSTAVNFGGSNDSALFLQLTGMSGLVAGDATLIFMSNSAALMYLTGCEL